MQRTMKRILFTLCLALSLVACKKQPFLDVDRSSLSLDAAGGTEKLTVSANYPWTASASAAWIKVSYTEGENTLTVNISRNNDTDARQGTVTLESEGLSRTVSVSQGQRDAIELDSAGRITVDSEAQQIEIKLRSNVEMVVSVTEGSDWLSVVSTKAMTSRTVTLAVKANGNRAMRRALVSFTDKGNAVTQQVMVDQEGKPQVLLLEYAGVSQFPVPLVSPPSGVALSGFIFWNGGSDPVAYDKSLVHAPGTDGKGQVLLELHNAETVSVPVITGLTRMDLSGF